MIRKRVMRAVLGGVLVCLASIMAGCGCTSSYWESLCTLGIGCQYCGKGINGSRCFTPEGHHEKGCHCNAQSPCWGAKKTSSLDTTGNTSCCSSE